MKPYIHALSSVRLFGGRFQDYIALHQWMDETKAYIGSNVHRAMRHHSQGIFEGEKIFGIFILNSDKKEVQTRDIFEQHVVEDLGFIPTVCDYLENLEYQPWMSREENCELPSSQKGIKKDVDKLKKSAKV